MLYIDIFSTPFFFYCYSMAPFVLEPRLVRASLRSNAKREKITSVEQAMMFCFPCVSRFVKKKGKNREQSCQLKGDR